MTVAAGETQQGTGGDTTQPGEQQASQQGAANPAAGAAQDAGKGQQSSEGATGEPEYVFDMPEGIEIDSGTVTEFTALAKELNISPDAAKRIVDLEVKRVQTQIDAHNATIAEWATQTQNDPEIGGAKFTENVALARTAIDTFGSPALKQLLNETGFGNHPEIVKLAVKVGKAISEDRFVKGEQRPANTDEARAQSMFPSMRQQ